MYSRLTIVAYCLPVMSAGIEVSPRMVGAWTIGDMINPIYAGFLSAWLIALLMISRGEQLEWRGRMKKLTPLANSKTGWENPRRIIENTFYSFNLIISVVNTQVEEAKIWKSGNSCASSPCHAIGQRSQLFHTPSLTDLPSFFTAHRRSHSSAAITPSLPSCTTSRILSTPTA